MGVIFVDGLEINACHGVNAEEKTQPQPFILDAEIETDFYAAVKSDGLEDTINYSSVCKALAGAVTGNCFNLIEKLAAECAFTVMEKFGAKRAAVTVNKPCAPMKRKFDNVGVKVEFTRERACLAIGSSLGDRKAYLDGAVGTLGSTRGIKVKEVSKYIETEPYGGVAENKFLNAAVLIETYLPPRWLLNEIHRIEDRYGRVRDRRWGDRTLDIDIIFYGDRIISEEGLTVPHPEYALRDFVLIPLKEIAGDFVCPIMKKRVKDL